MNATGNYITQNLDKLEPAVKNILKEMECEVLMLCRFGSHLYGTDTPDSDTDYKGVFMPTSEMVLMGEIPKSINNNVKKPEGQKNTSEDIDYELYSLHYIIELACKGDTAALDMLHVNKENLLVSSDIWDSIIEQRSMFYTKDLTSFVEYARKQAAKYGIKGSRLNAAKEFIAMLSNESDHTKRVREIWDSLPVNEHAFFIEENANGIRQYQICGKIIQESVTFQYAQGIVLNYYQQYGKRAEQAAKNEGIDWKAVSHALRAAYQLKEIYKDGTITFPLKKAEFVKQVKLGKLDFLTQVQPKLENLISALELYVKRSTLPNSVDTEHWRWFVRREVLNYVARTKATLTLKELNRAVAFAEKHGEGEYKAVTITHRYEQVGTSYKVSTDNHEEDITEIESW